MPCPAEASLSRTQAAHLLLPGMSLWPLTWHVLHCCRCGLTFSFFMMRYMMQVERAEAEAYDRVCCR